MREVDAGHLSRVTKGSLHPRINQTRGEFAWSQRILERGPNPLDHTGLLKYAMKGTLFEGQMWVKKLSILTKKEQVGE